MPRGPEPQPVIGASSSIDWTREPLSSRLEVLYGKANPGRSGAIPVVGSSGVYGSTDTALVEEPTVVIGRKGNAGKAWFLERPCYPSDTTFYLRRRQDHKVDMRFVHYAITHFGPGASDDVIPSLQRHELEGLELPFPDLPEQRAIAGVLAKIQRAVEVEDKRIAALKELKAATMAKVFREGLHGEPLKETAIGLIPNCWEVLALGSALRTAQYGLSVRGGRTGRVPILRMNCQQDGRVVFRDLQYVQLDERSLRAFRLQDGDLLFNRTNSFDLVGRTALFSGDREAVFASYLIRLQVDPEVFMPSFLNYYLNLESAQQAIKSLATRGVSQSNISASKLKTFQVPKPPLPEQLEIAGMIQTIASSLQACEQRREARYQLFLSALQQLMTGQLRVTPLLNQEEASHA